MAKVKKVLVRHQTHGIGKIFQYLLLMYGAPLQLGDHSSCGLPVMRMHGEPPHLEKITGAAVVCGILATGGGGGGEVLGPPPL